MEEALDVFYDESLYAVAEFEPERPLGGRPAMFPNYMIEAYGQLTHVFTTATQVEAELADPANWRRIRRVVRKMNPDDPSKWLGPQPMRRYHYDYGRNRRASTPEWLAQCREEQRTEGAALAREMGLMNPKKPGSFRSPSRDTLVYGDGKVHTPLYRGKPGAERVDKATGEIRPVRADVDASMHTEGGGHPVYGVKFNTLMTRGAAGRVILNVDHVSNKPGEGGEAGVMLRMLGETIPLLPGARAFAYDGAWKGVHIQALMTEYGVESVCSVTAAAAERRVDGQTVARVPKRAEVEVISVVTKSGKSVPVKILAEDGAAGIELPSADGTPVFVKLKQGRVHRTGKPGRFRWYGEYKMPPEFGGQTVHIRLHGADGDKGGAKRRPEILRAIPPGDPRFDRLYSRRADVESLHRNIENRMYWNRAHSLGASRQLFDQICHARLVNAVTKGRARGRERLAVAA